MSDVKTKFEAYAIMLDIAEKSGEEVVFHFHSDSGVDLEFNWNQLKRMVCETCEDIVNKYDCFSEIKYMVDGIEEKGYD